MLLEAALLGCFVYIVGTGKSARAAARTVGYGVGRAAGSLRLRVRTFRFCLLKLVCIFEGCAQR